MGGADARARARGEGAWRYEVERPAGEIVEPQEQHMERREQKVGAKLFSRFPVFYPVFFFVTVCQEVLAESTRVGPPCA